MSTSTHSLALWLALSSTAFAAQPRITTAIRPVGAFPTLELAARATARVSPAFRVVDLRTLVSGGTRVSMRAEVDGIEVLGTDVKVLFSDGGTPISVTRGEAVTRFSARRPAPATISSAGALDILGAAPDSRVRPVFVVAADRALHPALVIEYRVGRELRRAVVDTASGAVVQDVSLTADASFQVYAETTGSFVPRDSACADASPYLGGLDAGSVCELEAPGISDVDGLNTNPSGDADPWLPEGAETLSGNNAHVTANWNDDGNVTELYGTSAGEFAQSYDFNLAPDASPTQAEASGAHAFYIVNWLHDLYYDAGFDEAAGNAQADNFGRGGVEGDPLQVYVQDAAHTWERNNANMTTPGDGASPTLRVYVHTGRSDVSVPGTGDSFPAGAAWFGASGVSVTAPLAWAAAEDGNVEGCDPIVTDLHGKIGLIDPVGSHNCRHTQIAANVQAAGAIGMIEVLAGSDGILTGLSVSSDEGGDVEAAAIVIPVVTVEATLGEALRGVADAEQEVSLSRGIDYDGTFDSTTVAHEFGHYLHFRHVVQNGQAQLMGMSEGWGDITALAMMLRDGDALDGIYVYAPYGALATRVDPFYFGERRMPYSTDRSVNDLSFRHIASGEDLPDVPILDNGADNTEVHSVGEVWASMLFGAYVSLQRERTTSFEDVREQWAALMVSALSITPDSTTFTEGRDAVIAAALAGSVDDATLIAEAFAGRGLGTCAESPSWDSVDLEDVVEDFEVRPLPSLGAVTTDDDGESCDGDGILDAGESGTISIVVDNTWLGTLTSGVVTVSVDDPEITFPDGTDATVDAIGPLGETTVTFAVAVGEGIAPQALPVFTFTLTDTESCVGSISEALGVLVDADGAETGSMTDTFDAAMTWTPEDPWAASVVDGDQSWVGAAGDVAGEGRLVSPPMDVTGDLRLSIEHGYALQDAFGVGRDGGVIELRVDGGDWQDVSTWADPGYPDAMGVDGGTELDGRPAFSGTSEGWPELTTLDLNLGGALVGHSVEIGFHLASDGAAGTDGWQIGSVTVAGVPSGPFPRAEADPHACAEEEEASGGCGCTSGGAPSILALLAVLGLRRRG